MDNLYDKIYLSSNISFLLDCYINSFKNLKLCIIDKNSNLGGAWQVSNSRVHLQWIHDKSHVDQINKDLSIVDKKYKLKGPLKYVKTLDNTVYKKHYLYHINKGSNEFIKDLIKKIKNKNNIDIIKDEIKKIDNNNVYGNYKYSFKKLYLTNNIKLRNYININKTYNHYFIEVSSSLIKPLDVLICDLSYYKPVIKSNIFNSLFFLLNVTSFYPLKKDTQYFSCRIKTNNFTQDFKEYLIKNKITNKDVKIKILEKDTYIQNRLYNFNHKAYSNIHYFNTMNYFKFLVKCAKLR
tara:strand:- start:7 stop:888 length:882 start_codon:yes stop_codon:yes gene_type:complete